MDCMAELVGTSLKDRYFLRQLVGSGGMSDVYLAWDKMRSAKMAVKVMYQDVENPDRFFRTFAKDAELLRKLEHPNIVRLYEFERDGEIVFIVMDWIDGRNLRQAISERKTLLPLEEISRILGPVSSALNYAHQNGVVHCDVKPANILLHNDGRVLLSDFGVARVALEQKGGGTVAYMAPEQFSGENVDFRADIYGLGITLYEMLSGGKVPFWGDSPDSQGSTQRERIEWEHLHQYPPPISRFNPQIGKPIEAVVQMALSKDPDQRYPTTLALRDAFEKARFSNKGREEVVRSTADEREPTHAPKAASPPSKVAPPGAVKGPRLLGQGGEWAGQAIPIPKQGLTIGRGSHNQLRLRESSVSRIHAVILRTRRGTYIRDEGSTVGTFVNGERIYGLMALRSGDTIRLGNYLVFEYREK